VSQIITQDIDFLREETTFGPSPDGESAWYPDQFYDVTRTAVQTGTEITNRSQLVITPAQYKPTSEGAGRLRIYSEVTFKVIYIDPNAAQAEQTLSDDTPPIIDTVRAISNAPIGSPAHRVAVLARDDTSATADLRVEGVYLQDGTIWQPLSFSLSSTPDLWIAEVPTELGATNYIITVSDEAGNAASYTGKGRLAVPTIAIITEATIAGPENVIVGSTGVFTVSLSSATPGDIEPVQYTWQPEPDEGQGTEVVTYTFDTLGTQQISVEAENRAGSLTRTRSVTVTTESEPADRLYLPLIIR
jgi:hypothetical protein